MRLGFLGGTGVEGRGLALRFAAAGAMVTLGSRSIDRAARAAAECDLVLGKEVTGAAVNEEMLAHSEIVFLAVPFDKALGAIESYATYFHPGQVLVDVTVPMVFSGGRVEYLEQEGRSNAEILAAGLPTGVELVGAFKTIPARLLAATARPLECDVFVCGDSKYAKEKTMEAANLIPSVRALDAGPLSGARILERMTVLAVRLNRRYKSHDARFRVIGI